MDVETISYFIFNTGSFTGEDNVGEVDIQIDLFTYAASGEHKVTVKGKRDLLMFWFVLFYMHFANPALK